VKRELFWFAVVGVSALLVHYGLVTLLLVPLGLAPLLANVIGFLLAFQVSYWGHRRLTFRAGNVAHSQALPRFFAVAALSFCVNETLYFLLLNYTQLNYRSALLIVLFTVALLTFVLGKLWAFSGARHA
jgi:putative flippase GtrA